VGGVDLSPLILLVILQVILIAPMLWLELEAAKPIARLFGVP
jgi:uncharacterized protein YggT (Ycf19 family)